MDSYITHRTAYVCVCMYIYIYIYIYTHIYTYSTQFNEANKLHVIKCFKQLRKCLSKFLKHSLVMTFCCGILNWDAALAENEEENTIFSSRYCETDRKGSI